MESTYKLDLQEEQFCFQKGVSVISSQPQLWDLWAKVHKSRTLAKCSTSPSIWIHPTSLCNCLVCLKNPDIFIEPQRFHGIQLLFSPIKHERLRFH